MSNVAGGVTKLMNSHPEFVNYLLELFESFGQVTAKRMFGSHGLFRDGLIFALIIDDTLYLKVDENSKKDFEVRGLRPFEYEKKGKTVTVSYYQAPEEAMENSDEMNHWASKAFAAALRANTPKKKTGKKKNG